ncbi:hypothetical protein [Polaribacter sp. Hel1_85]|uniref:hypothetical protein n=1 Tax=Polaribacter sp. Hel1_85 TaxID=1250005 RepID=UPI00055EA63C|nr:hypothetical protein [Polaribacter sp. Hel1_85]
MTKIGFNLNKINTLQFAIIDDAFNSELDEFNVETNLGYGLDTESDSMLSLVKIQFEQKEVPFMIIEVSCEFDVVKSFWDKFKDSESIIIPKGFMAHLAMITVGTTRGILHEKTRNTKFNEFIVPMINVSEMIKEDGEFSK